LSLCLSFRSAAEESAVVSIAYSSSSIKRPCPPQRFAQPSPMLIFLNRK
jgi:hypothetical protein